MDLATRGTGRVLPVGREAGVRGEAGEARSATVDTRPAWAPPVPARMLGLGVVMVGAATAWITLGHLALGMGSSVGDLAELVNDLVPIVIAASIGTVGASRWAAERERTLRALRDSEARARDLFEQSPDGILVSDATGRYVEVNRALCRMLGYERAELLAMHAGDLTAGDDPIGNAGMDTRLAEAMGESGILVERRYRRRDGRSLPVEVRFRVLPDGRQQRNVRDITDRLRTEAAEVREAEIRAALTDALQQVSPEANIDQASQAICDVLAALPGVDFTGVEAFLGEDEVVMLAGTVPPDFPTHPGEAMPAERARYLQERAAQGPWAEHWAPRGALGLWGEAVTQAGVRAVAFGPIVHGDHVEGVLVMGTADPEFAQTLVERMPGVAAFTATTTGLLAERLHERRHEVELRRHIGRIIDEGAFHPVFQPIVDLSSGEAIAFEALARFDSGQRPDLCFADARAVGLGDRLELAVLAAALHAARELPAGRWLDVNVSPHLVENGAPMRDALREADRLLVLEITEHDAVADYGRLRRAVRALGSDVRIAVDDAGAGEANFGHIVELRPDFVKLDIGLVRSVNSDLGRQALVVGMRHFARTAGCRLVAEGIETDEEARTLAQLGVEFGQGYLFGRPERAGHWRTIPAARTDGKDATPAPRTPWRRSRENGGASARPAAAS